jgi:hypothetical protein
MARLLIEDITIPKGEQIRLDIRSRGGAAKTLLLPKPLSFCESHRQDPAMVAELDRLLDDYNYVRKSWGKSAQKAQSQSLERHRLIKAPDGTSPDH